MINTKERMAEKAQSFKILKFYINSQFLFYMFQREYA